MRFFFLQLCDLLRACTAISLQLDPSIKILSINQDILRRETTPRDQPRNLQDKDKATATATMTLNEAAAAPGRRDRAYSDAHAIVAKGSRAPTAPDADEKNSDVPSINKAMCPKKHQHHHGNRPRSKSCDLHRHAAPLHKRKYPNHHKHIPMLQLSPTSDGRYGRLSPTHSSLVGKMWVRPAAAMGYGDAAKKASTDGGPVRQVTDGSSSAASPVDDMLCHGSPISFDIDHTNRGQSPPRIVFGESGRPLRPRTGRRHDPADGVA